MKIKFLKFEPNDIIEKTYICNFEKIDKNYLEKTKNFLNNFCIHNFFFDFDETDENEESQHYYTKVCTQDKDKNIIKIPLPVFEGIINDKYSMSEIEYLQQTSLFPNYNKYINILLYKDYIIKYRQRDNYYYVDDHELLENSLFSSLEEVKNTINAILRKDCSGEDCIYCPCLHDCYSSTRHEEITKEPYNICKSNNGGDYYEGYIIKSNGIHFLLYFNSALYSDYACQCRNNISIEPTYVAAVKKLRKILKRSLK